MNGVYYYTLLYLILFFIAQCFSMWGQYFILKYKNISMWEAYKIAIPFAWIAWIIMSYVVHIGNLYVKVAPQFNMMLLIIFQYIIIYVINDKYLMQPSSRSDIICFIIIVFAYVSSYYHVVSKIYNPDDFTAHSLNLVRTFNSNHMPIKKYTDPDSTLLS